MSRFAAAANALLNPATTLVITLWGDVTPTRPRFPPSPRIVRDTSVNRQRLSILTDAINAGQRACRRVRARRKGAQNGFLKPCVARFESCRGRQRFCRSGTARSPCDTGAACRSTDCPRPAASNSHEVVRFGVTGMRVLPAPRATRLGTGAVAITSARSVELEEASTEPRECSDPGHGSYQNESRRDPPLDAVDVSPELGLDALAVAVSAALSEVAHQRQI